jgi:hypothetical protein
MNNLYFSIFLILNSLTAFGQSFHSAPGTPGTNAIKKDSACFVAWANNIEIKRGFLTIADTFFTINNSNKVDFGLPQMALGPAEGDGSSVVSLGDFGSAILTFPLLITDQTGADFAIFENSFSDNYMELAHVEVSSDGIHFFRFPSVSEQPTAIQLTNFTYSDCRMVNNLAGKYRAGFGTPFDLSDLSNNPLLNKQAITHVKLIDVVGSIDANYGTTDEIGTLINDAFPTPFASGGFDLDAVGIIHGTLDFSEDLIDFEFFPNPVIDCLTINSEKQAIITIYDMAGKFVTEFRHESTTTIHPTNWQSGLYTIKIQGDQRIFFKKIMIE